MYQTLKRPHFHLNPLTKEEISFFQSCAYLKAWNEAFTISKSKATLFIISLNAEYMNSMTLVWHLETEA